MTATVVRSEPAARRTELEARWVARIARARQLAKSHAPAAELLRFYATVAEFQRALLPTETPTLAPRVASSDLRTLAGMVPALLRVLEHDAPPLLADAAERMHRTDSREWQERLRRHWVSSGNDVDGVEESVVFVAEAVLQPFAERCALDGPAGPGVRHVPENTSRGACCPACGGRPVVAVLRDDAESARRSLVCGLCLTEFAWPRIVCPACGETAFGALPVFAADAVPATRVDACDTCRTYVRTVDLTRDGRALPIVDEMAGVALDLWARAQGYRKLRPNLFRL